MQIDFDKLWESMQSTYDDYTASVAAPVRQVRAVAAVLVALCTFASICWLVGWLVGWLVWGSDSQCACSVGAMMAVAVWWVCLWLQLP